MSNRNKDDPCGYLETEARIIVEDDHYAVLAIRIEKATIRRNMGFLSALANLVPALIAGGTKVI